MIFMILVIRLYMTNMRVFTMIFYFRINIYSKNMPYDFFMVV